MAKQVAKQVAKKKRVWRARVGISWDGGGLEPGERSTDIPAASLPWLLEIGAIEECDAEDAEDAEDGEETEEVSSDA